MRLNGKFILVIDDDQAMLRALTRVLTGEGGLVASASWAGEAIDFLKGQPFDLIITDLRMPVFGGETILRGVKAALPRVPVIVITAFGTPELKADCLSKGAAAFLEKPLDTPQLLEAIIHALERSGTDDAPPRRREQRTEDPDTSTTGLKRDAFKLREHLYHGSDS